MSAVEDELLGVQCLEVDVDRLMAHGDGKKYRRARKHKKALLEEEIISEVARITETEIVTHPEKGSVSFRCNQLEISDIDFKTDLNLLH